VHIHKSITTKRVEEMAKRDDCEGICIACGEDAYGVEPDARNYECEYCGARKVFGAEELLFIV
jgi:DNA-directed RNA polymerase subunit RPC12/RpoP